jgi:hypothetical protein
MGACGGGAGFRIEQQIASFSLSHSQSIGFARS